ncbi:hypothetical protein I4U23_021392 [Adineta vaga]|nr:hypothetical protein I4U23_021392 [Adineta vaga]
MNRSRSQLDTYHSRPLSLHKPGVIPYASQNISPITSNRHKYELKQKVWSKQSVESWFANHSFDDRQAVFSFLNTLYDNDKSCIKKEDRTNVEQRRKSPAPASRLSNRQATAVVVQSPNHSAQRRSKSNHGRESRASKRDLGEVLESLESFRPTTSAVQEKGIQTSATSIVSPLPDVNGGKSNRKIEKYTRRSVTSMDKHLETEENQNTTNNDEDNKLNRRYLSQTWRVINPREDMEPNVRPENNRSSFFNYTKKVYPEYFFIHPDWY